MINTQMLRNGLKYNYLGMECRYLTSLENGKCLIQLSVNGKKIEVHRYEVISLKLKEYEKI